MLSYQLMKRNAGIVLCGDADTLAMLYEIVHQADKAPIIADTGDPDQDFIALAYDLRKAYTGQRFVLDAGRGSRGPLYGVEIIWPVFLFQTAVLRRAFAFIDTNKTARGYALLLEGVAEEALTEALGRDAAERVVGVVDLIWPSKDPRRSVLQARGGLFLSWSAAQRKSRLLPLMGSMIPELFEVGARAAGGVTSEEIAAWEGREWPAP